MKRSWRAKAASTIGCSLTVLALAGCTLAPKYERPRSPVDRSYTPTASADGKVVDDQLGTEVTQLGWRQFFRDPVMQDVLALALANNRDLRVAALNVSVAEAEYRIQRADLLPTVNGTAGAEFERTPPAQSGTPTALQTHSYSLGLSVVSYELDLFGRLRSLSKEAQESYLSSADTKLATQLTLVAQVASTYLSLLADRDALKVARDTVATQQSSFDLIKMTTDQGTGTDLDVARAETTLRTAQASLEQYTRQAATDLDSLQLLVGAPLPAPLRARMDAQTGLAAVVALPPLAAGLPSDLLERRPDIRAAEHTLMGANANIGAARAAFFPAVTLTGNVGTASGGINHLFGAGTSAWTFQPQVSLPIFDAGANIARLDVAHLQKRIEIANYEKAIEQAFRDVADALASRATYVRQLEAQRKLVDADTRYRDVSQMRFDAGADDYLNVLVAQNSLFSAQLDLVSLELAERQNLVTLYKALGGGWAEKGGERTAAR